MLSELFLPERLGNKRILAKKIVSFFIEDETVTAAVVHAKRSKTIVEKLINQPIEANHNLPYEERSVEAIKKIISQVKNFDQIRIAIPSSLVIFKEINIPFVNKDKIQMILDYEIEPMLPFSINEAVTDFIVTKKTKTKQKTESQALVAIARKEDIKKILDVYNAAEIEPNNITIDLLAIYSMYQQIDAYNKIQQSVAIINLGKTCTQIAFLHKGQLRLSRYISKGINDIAKNISDSLETDFNQTVEKLLNQGINPIIQNNFSKAANEQLLKFFHEIQFTLNSFAIKLNLEAGIGNVLFTGTGCQIKGLVKFVNNLFQIPCEIFKSEKIFSNKFFKNKIREKVKDWNLYTIALGTAIPSDQQFDFELRRKEFALPKLELLKKQVIAAALIVITIFGIMGFKGYTQISNLKNKANQIEQKKIKQLKKIFPEKSPALRKKRLQPILKEATKLVNKKTELWHPFTKDRLKILPILQELTHILDRRKFDVDVNEISIEDIENETSFIEVNGYFKSKTGSDHFKFFSKLEERFEKSQLLKLREEVDPKLSDDKGIEFVVKLKIRE